jgi:prepilin signal peptidase PulO-like enzyme (type II secretory pathway)
MKLMIIVLLVVFGLVLGSFVNALVWRFHKQAELADQPVKKTKKTPKKVSLTAGQLSMVKGRSMCSRCHHELAPKDLVPLFSWLWLRGKCRYCGVKIEDNPLIEALLPVFFVVSYLSWPLNFHGLGLYQFIFWLVFLVGFMALAVYDLRWFLLPNRIVYPLIGLALLEILGEVIFYHAGWPTLASAFWGVVFASGIFYLLFILSNGNWIGGGDVKLGIVLGLLVGGPLNGLLLIFIASLLGSLVALPLLAAGKAERTSRLPFGPYLLFATVIVMLYGPHIVAWYDRLAGLG